MHTTATASLVFGLCVDPLSVMYAARAWNDNKVPLKYLDGLISGTVKQNEVEGTSLPAELLRLVRGHLWDSALQEASCPAWAHLGDKGYEAFHPDRCGCPGFERTVGSPCPDCGADHMAREYRADIAQAQVHYSEVHPADWQFCVKDSCNCQLVKAFLRAHDVDILYGNYRSHRLLSWLIGADNKDLLGINMFQIQSHTPSKPHEVVQSIATNEVNDSMRVSRIMQDFAAVSRIDLKQHPSGESHWRDYTSSGGGDTKQRENKLEQSPRFFLVLRVQ